jgi:triosephosphate isomerase (TIM)
MASLSQHLIIAYEPVWAIGTGKSATAEVAEQVHSQIRSRVATLCGDSVGQAMRILYGGSAKPNNISELLAQPDIDGALVGGASLKPAEFAQMVQGATL